MGVRQKRVTLTSVACPTIHALTPVETTTPSKSSSTVTDQFNTSWTITFNYRKPAVNAFSVRGHPVSEFSPNENQKM